MLRRHSSIIIINSGTIINLIEWGHLSITFPQCRGPSSYSNTTILFPNGREYCCFKVINLNAIPVLCFLPEREDSLRHFARLDADRFKTLL